LLLYVSSVGPVLRIYPRAIIQNRLCTCFIIRS
jgi:hypothetical protein